MDRTNLNQAIEQLSTALRTIAESSDSSAQEIIKYLEFRAKPDEKNTGKGIIWSGDGTTKQIIYNIKPDRFFVSEHIDLHKGKHVSIGNIKVLDETSLGDSIQTSNLRQVGKLNGLIVAGSVNIDNEVNYIHSSKRIGIGLSSPNAKLGILDNGVELAVGANENKQGIVGTYTGHDFAVQTSNTTRLTVKANGDIELGSTKKDVQVKVHGKLSVGIEMPDPTVDLHVGGSVRMNGRLYLSASQPPLQGTYSVGDVVWNDVPKLGGYIGWVCLNAGSPGRWFPFGEIKEQVK